ncbi:hypothetical protein [Streptomyces sp. NPDC051776]|uniref:hypothetical protein n=1 Tax=Streptomyces sp. NPDC051776 TaxID=3155414 RepID=UPI003430DC09
MSTTDGDEASCYSRRGESTVGSTAGVWTGRALAVDPRISEFNADPAAYIRERAETLRSANFDEEQAKLIRQQKQRTRAVIRKVLRHLYKPS